MLKNDELVELREQLQNVKDWLCNVYEVVEELDDNIDDALKKINAVIDSGESE